MPKPGHITVLYLIYLSISNFFDCIAKKAPAIDYISYVAIFAVFALVLLILENCISTKKLLSIIFLLIGMVGQILMDTGCLFPAIFCSMSIFLMNRKKFTFFVVGMLGISMVARGILNHYTANDTLNYLSAEYFILFLYFSLWHPKNPKLKEVQFLSSREKEIIRLLASGYKYKEIPAQLKEYISASTIRTDMERIRNKFDADNNEEVFYKIAKMGIWD